MLKTVSHYSVFSSHFFKNYFWNSLIIIILNICLFFNSFCLPSYILEIKSFPFWLFYTTSTSVSLGILTIIFVPCFSLLSTSILPFIKSTILFTIANPKPLPSPALEFSTW